MVEQFLNWIEGLPPALIYIVIGAGAAIENVVPPIPADTFVLFGGFLAGRGALDPWITFGSVWALNVGSAIAMYEVARRKSDAIRDSRAGRWLLEPHQMERIGDFYKRWGTPAIFASRFLPALRAIVPVFAGLSGVGFWRMAVPTAVASAIWYGALVYVGAIAGRNWQRIRDTVGAVNLGLLALAVILIALIVWWWRRTRSESESRA
ncbi:MAG: DedA family protein [Longimicrobiales bacterium]